MNTSQAIARNGTQQYERLADELSVDFASIEERSVEQQLVFMSKLAEHIRFFNLENEVDGDWLGLFEIDPADMLAYMDDPASFNPDPESPVAEQRYQLDRVSQLSQPQLVMVYIFVRMSQAIRSQFNQLTQKHLDFYYREVLQMQPAKGRADQLHLTCELSESAQGTVLAQGTLIDAGTDSQGQAIQYVLDDNYQINQAQIAQVKSLRVSRQYISLNKMRQNYENGFEVVLRWALGQYFQGDLLPPYPLGRYYDRKGDVAFLLESYNIYKAYDGSNLPDDVSQEQLDAFTGYENYIEVVLGFASLSDFNSSMAVYAQSIDAAQPYPDDSQWILATQNIELAATVRWQQRQMQQLFDNYRPAASEEPGRLQSLFETIFGDPESGDPLPAMPTTDDTLESLYLLLNDANKKSTDDYKLAARYIAGLGLNVKDYLFIYAMHLTSADLYQMPLREVLDPNQPAETSWYRFFYKLQRMEAKLRDKKMPDAGRWDVRNMLPNNNVSLGAGTPAFGEVDDYKTTDSYYGPGLAVVSPLLHLEEGERNIHLEVACEQQNFPMDDLLLAKAKGKLHFQLDFSGESGWQTLYTQTNGDVVEFNVTNIGDELIETYSPEQLDLVVSVQSREQSSDQLSEGIQTDDYLILDDGSIWQVSGVDNSTQQVQLRYLNQVNGLSNNQNLRVSQLDFVQEARVLTRLSYAPNKLEVTLEANDDNADSVSEVIAQGDFIVLSSGQVLLITQLIEDGQKAKVEALGYLPDVMMTSFNDPDGENGTEDTHYLFTSLALKEADLLGDIEVQHLADSSANSSYSSSDNISDNSSSIVFTQADLGRLMRYPNGFNLQIRQLLDPITDENAGGESISEDDPDQTYTQALVEMQPVQSVSYTDLRIKKYSSYPGFVFDIKLDATSPAVTPSSASEAVPGFTPIEPVLKLQLASIVDTNSEDGSIDMAYQYLKDIQLHNVKLSVSVKGLSNLQLANDDNTLAPGQPFEPFGRVPYVGSAFYFSHYELSRKKLSNISLNMQWVELPERLDDHYKAYINAYPDQVPALTNSSFQVGMSMFNQRSWIDQNQGELLFNIDADNNSHITIDQGLTHSAYDFLPDYNSAAPASPLKSERYFKVALQAPDFQHKIYPHVMRKLSLAAAQNEGEELELINDPYTPKVKMFTVDYQAEELITPDYYNDDQHSFLAHLHPFGGINVNLMLDPDKPTTGVRLLPKFDDEGYLYLGLSNAQPEDEISLLVQVLTGSGKANLDTPRLHWYYRSEAGITPLPSENLLHDTTTSMSFSGLIRLRLPTDATLNGPLLPAGYHWLAVQVVNNADAAAKLVALTAQAVSATRTSSIGVGENPILVAGSVKGLVNKKAGLEKVSQPFDSFNGQAMADTREFYRDVSERLRHRNRAINQWDYERLALSRFPQLRQVKCLNNAELAESAPGEVSLMVIPELSSQPLDEVLTPAASPDLLEQVRLSLVDIVPPDCQLQVKNPYYQALRFRVGVRFNEGFGPGIYSPKVVTEIKKLLTPWAESQAEPLQLGNRLYFSELINHLERLPYVDYIAVLKGFKLVTLYQGSEDKGSEEETEQWQEIEDSSFQVDRPDSLLVSDKQHRVDVITGGHFSLENYMGIGYMVVELDNVVQ